MGSSVWTREQVLALASNDSAQKAGLALASAKKWTLLGQHAEAAWGLCQGSGKDPYLTSIALDEPAFACSCPSRKFPCKHGLGLLLLHADQALSSGEPPEWVTTWLETRRKRAEKKAASLEPSGVSPETKAKLAATLDKRLAKREERMHAGIDEAGRF